MFDLPTDILLEGLVAVLLVATVVYCALLDRRLKALRSGQDGLRQIISDLNQATEQARVAVSGLKAASDEIGTELDGKLSSGRELSEELSMMVNAGERIADKLGDVADRSAGGISHRGMAEDPLFDSSDEIDDPGAPGDDMADGDDVSGLQSRLKHALRRAR